MTQVISLFFVVLAIVVFLGIIGAPIWLIIYLIHQTKKTGKFPWKKLIIAVVVIFLLITGISMMAGGILTSTQQNFGVSNLDRNFNQDQNATVNEDGGITLPKAQ